MRALFVLGRAIFGGFFLWNGLNHLQNHDTMAQYAASKGVASADQAVRLTAAMLLAGGASVVAGVKPRHGLALIVAFLVPVSLQMHRFWEIDDPGQRMSEMVNFTKNMALIGAALALLQVEDPWPASLDRVFSADEEMYVRLGGRDLRALPA